MAPKVATFGAPSSVPLDRLPTTPAFTTKEGALMAKPATGQVIEAARKKGRVYSIRFRVGGKRHQVTLGAATDGWSRAAAEAELQNVLADVRRGIWKPPNPEPEVGLERTWTFHEWATKFLDDRRPHLRPRSIESWEWALSNHLLPHFAPFLLTEITKLAVRDYINEKVRDREYSRVERPLSNRSINRTRARLADILEEAVDFDLIVSNPARSKRLPLPEEPAKRRWLQIEHVLPLIDAAGQDRALVATLLLAGARIGEALAFEWRDVDLAAGTLRVRQSKTPAGVRTIDLTAFTRRELLEHKLASNYSAPNDLVFPTSSGSRGNRHNVLKRVLRGSAKRANAVLAESGVPLIPEDLTNHDLRRVFSSLLDEVNAPSAYKDQQRGHKGRGLADAYERPFKRDRNVGEMIDALIDSASVRVGPPAEGTSATAFLRRDPQRLPRTH
ncbi:MAG: integrase [Solirubrobacteraceae bacterium]|nr:integrase [Solirubrobacteraceae bacterium]